MSTVKNKYRSIYLSSLAAIALLVASSNFVIDSIVSEEVLMVEVNEIGGRQRMLSERVVHLLLEFAVETDPNERENISKLIEEVLVPFDITHNLLIRGRFSDGETVVFEDNIDHLFFDAPQYLDEKARIFMYNTREVLSRKWSPELISSFYLREIREASKQNLHAGMQELARLYTLNSQSRITNLRIIVAFLLSAVILLVIGIGVFVFKPLFLRITSQQAKLQHLAYRDPLTNVHNRRSFFMHADAEYERCRQQNKPFAVLFIDIDYLKAINDTFGHAIGDIVIQEIASFCQQNIRDVDILGRIGGDEFGLLLPEYNLEQASVVAEQLRSGMANQNIPEISDEIQVSLSIGVATVIEHDKNADETIRRADTNLFEAKRTGRNLIIAV